MKYMIAALLLLAALLPWQAADEAADTAVIAEASDAQWVYEDPDENARSMAAVALEMHRMEGCTITAYCPCVACCGEWSGGATAGGVMPQSGHTVAVDPDVIPLGGWVVIGGEWYRAEDTGAFSGNHVDIYMDSHEAALAFGRRNETVYWLEA